MFQLCPTTTTTIQKEKKSIIAVNPLIKFACLKLPPLPEMPFVHRALVPPTIN